MENDQKADQWQCNALNAWHGHRTFRTSLDINLQKVKE